MWNLILPAAGGILGGILGNSSSKRSSAAAQAGMQQGVDTIKGYYDEAKGNLSPYMQTGTQANSGIAKLLNGDYSGFYNAPDFQARLQAGGDMFDSSAAARGGVFGGGATRGREMYAQQLAAQGLGDYRNWLGNVSGAGQNAATGLSQMGANAGSSIANLYTGMGQANANGIAQRGANGAGMLGSIGGLLGGLLGGR